MTGRNGNAPSNQYNTIAADLRARLLAGHWAPGSQFPSRRALAREYQVAVMTVERAVALLIAEGLLHADGRRGTMVAFGVAPQPADPTPTLYSPNYDQFKPRAAVQATVGILTALIPYHDPYTYELQWPIHILRGCEAVLADEGGIIHRFANHPDAFTQPQLHLLPMLDQLFADRLDGLIVIMPTTSALDALIEKLIPQQLPTVCVSSSLVPHQIHQVTFDHINSGYQAGQHLLQRGYEHLIYFAPFTSEWVEMRLTGIQRAFQERSSVHADLRIYPEQPSTTLFPSAELMVENVRQRAVILLKSLPAATCIVAANDNIAEGVLQAGGDLGLQVGCDYGLIGFDDVPTSREVGLTSLRPPLEEMGAGAAKIMVDLLKQQTVPSQLSYRSMLIPRMSTAPTSPSDLRR